MDQNTQGAAAPAKVHVGGRLSKDRYILQQLVTKDFKLRYRRSVLGVVWSVLNPLLMMIIMSFVFQYFLRSNLEHYSLYLIVGNITFALMNDATNGGLRSIIDASSLLKKVKVDRWVFPVQKVFSAAVNFAFSLIAVAIVMVFDGVMPTVHVLWFVVGLVLVMLFSIGIGLFIGALAVFFRDMIHLWSVVLTAWTYLTPIFWDLSLLTNSNAPRIVVWIVKANPMYNYVTFMRMILLNGQPPELITVAMCAIWAVIAIALGWVVFHKLERKFILYI